MNTYLQAAIDAAPIGTTGLVVAPWAKSEVYGVAANWAHASAPVYFYGREKWETQQYQVADFRHKPAEALEREIAHALIDSGDGDSDVADICSNAEEFETRAGRVEMRKLLEGHGDRFSGNNAEDMANEWLDCGFNAESAGAWCEIGVWEPSIAKEFVEAGHTAEQVKQAAESLIDAVDHPDDLADLYTDGDPIYSVCNYDTSIADIIAAIPE